MAAITHTAQAHRRARQRRSLVITYLICFPAVLFAVLPIYWLINTSLKTDDDMLAYPPTFVPPHPTTQHYEDILFTSTIPQNTLNSLILVVATIALVLFLGVPAAYASVRFKFRGRQPMLFVMLATVMIPGVVTLVPQYFLVVRLGLHDTYAALVLIFAAWQLPTVVWIMRGFFENIPAEIDESALVDGCGRLTAFVRVVLPLAWPGIAASAILVFVWVWNEFIIALTLTASDSTRPLTVGLYFFVGESGIDWGRITAAAACALIPAVALFVVMQRRFVEGLTAGANKG